MGSEIDDREDDEERGRNLPSPPKPPPILRGWKRAVAIAFALFFMVGCFAGLASMYAEVRAGRGGELHWSMWGYKVSPIGILVSTGVAFIAFYTVSGIQWLQHRRDRAWERKNRRKAR